LSPRRGKHAINFVYPTPFCSKSDISGYGIYDSLRHGGCQAVAFPPKKGEVEENNAAGAFIC